jgi:hypothetical protein
MVKILRGSMGPGPRIKHYGVISPGGSSSGLPVESQGQNVPNLDRKN